MDQTLSYADILTRVVREEGKFQPRLQPIKIISVCDHETWQFLLIAVGRENMRRVDSIIFHAQLIDGTVVIETDNSEEGLTAALIEAGIREKDIISGEAFDELRSRRIAA
jgi:XisI protein